MSIATRIGDRVYSEVGSPDVVTYKTEVLKDGRLVLKPSGKKSLYDDIQSHKESTDIHVLLARYENGDLEALNRAQGVYANLADMPKNFYEWFNLAKESEQMFMELPLEVREKFGQSFENWAINIGTPEWMDKMGVSYEKEESGSTVSVDDSPKESDGE